MVNIILAMSKYRIRDGKLNRFMDKHLYHILPGKDEKKEINLIIYGKENNDLKSFSVCEIINKEDIIKIAYYYVYYEMCNIGLYYTFFYPKKNFFYFDYVIQFKYIYNLLNFLNKNFHDLVYDNSTAVYIINMLAGKNSPLSVFSDHICKKSDSNKLFINYLLYVYFSKCKIDSDNYTDLKNYIDSTVLDSLVSNMITDVINQKGICKMKQENKYFSKNELFQIYVMTNQIVELKNLLRDRPIRKT